MWEKRLRSRELRLHADDLIVRLSIVIRRDAEVFQDRLRTQSVLLARRKKKRVQSIADDRDDAKNQVDAG
jgi:hypothetical protein